MIMKVRGRGKQRGGRGKKELLFLCQLPRNTFGSFYAYNMFLKGGQTKEGKLRKRNVPHLGLK
jgi:ubiquinone biosynthesis protein Coq4